MQGTQKIKTIRGEPSLYCPTDDAFLVKFLRARKYDAQSAFDNIKKYFEVRRDHPEVFKDLTPSCIPFHVVCRKHRLLRVSRSTDSLGRMVVLNKIGAWNTDICTLNDYFRVGAAGLEYLLLRQDVQIKGIVCIVDLKGLNVYHLAHYTPSVIRKLLKIVQDSLPLRLKRIYIINNPPIFDLLFTIVKAFLKAKLLKRTRLFGYNLEELHHLVPDDVIPEGCGEKDESNHFDHWESAESFYQAMGSYGYRETLTETAPEPNGVSPEEELSSDDYVRL
ncbi:alpha-tocopherol transfer protein-like isoform X2 [Dermacentor silvarum]|uniref:alpha-tocopherol transfer protein-like isoform X2 n=1 Tax=Dermacentor silvarum TaxID=543639 RepID=UPI00210078CB|nr:alpha-tocopherol transfer protein-like isoform X2 [Dermacentor silvarum]